MRDSRAPAGGHANPATGPVAIHRRTVRWSAHAPPRRSRARRPDRSRDRRCTGAEREPADQRGRRGGGRVGGWDDGGGAARVDDRWAVHRGRVRGAGVPDDRRRRIVGRRRELLRRRAGQRGELGDAGRERGGGGGGERPRRGAGGRVGAPATLSALLGGYLTQADSAAVTATFLSAASGALGTLVAGPVTPDDQQPETVLLSRTATATVPAGTRSISVRIDATRIEGAFNDGYIDNVSLTLGSGGGPVYHKTVVANPGSGKGLGKRAGS